jgi:hypothetical protein
MTEQEMMETFEETTAFYPLKMKLAFLDRLKFLIDARYKDIQKRIEDEPSLIDDPVQR